jgi:hypothetical protein
MTEQDALDLLYEVLGMGIESNKKAIDAYLLQTVARMKERNPKAFFGFGSAALLVAKMIGGGYLRGSDYVK